MSSISGKKIKLHDLKNLNAAKAMQFESLHAKNILANKERAKRLYRSAPPGSGYYHTNLIEPLPHFVKAPCEKEIRGKNNTSIVLGRDRPGTVASGYGAKGATGAGCIDIVVGRMATSRDGPKDGVDVHSSFFADAARIYISQKTDIDTNFMLAGQPGHQNLKARSGIAVKADLVRIIGREGVKIVTGKAYPHGMPDGETNSLGGKISPAPPIELIAGNNTEPREKAIKLWEPPYIETVQTLQPVAMGYNTRDSLRELSKRLDELLGIVWNFMAKQLEYNFINNIDMMASWMPANAAVGATVNLRQIIKAWAPENAIRASLWAWEFNYLFPFSYKFVGSHNVRTT